MVLLVPLAPTASEATEGLEAQVLSSPVKKVSFKEPPEPIKDAFEVRTISSKGMGLFATRAIEAGEVIIRESPLILMPQKIFDDNDPDYIENWLTRRINRMTSEEREIFFSLADSRFSDGENKTALGIFYTNDMTFTDDSAALFPTMARANHSCTPNSDFVARDSLGVQDLVAVRPIQKDEEITLCYLPSSSTGSEVKHIRQSYTRRWYGFNCNCQACTLQGDAFDADELLRVVIRTYQSVPFEDLSAQEMEEFVDGLRRIGAKLPYLIEIAKLAFERALELKEEVLARKLASICYTASDIVHQHDDDPETNPFNFILDSKIVTIAGEAYLFHDI